MKKTLSFYLAAIGTVGALIALFLYRSSGKTMNYVITLNVIAIVAGVASRALYNKAGDRYWHPYLLSVAAVTVLGAMGYSLIVEVETLGYLISGLRQWSDVRMWAYFAAAAVISWLLLLVASFVKTPAAK